MLIRSLGCLILILFLQPSSFGAEIFIPFEAAAGRPYFESPETTIDSAEYNTLILQIEAKKSGAARLFWATHYNMQFSQPQSIWFSVKSGKHDYCFNIPSQNPNWIGWIKGFLIYPETGSKLIEIKQAKIAKANLLTNIRSGWREFFVFEVPQLRTVNFIYGPKIYGNSVNLFIYCLIILMSILIMIYEFIKSRDVHISFKMGSREIIIICLFFWMALDLRILIDQARTTVLDVQTFYGKSLDEKRALVTLGDYYGFLKFAGSKLPGGSGFNLLHPPRYYYLDKANYYLYPTHFDKNADYLIVYDPGGILNDQVSDYFKKGFKLFATYKEGEFILKK